MPTPTIQINIRMTVPVGKRVEAAAAAVGKSRTKFIMDVALAEAERVLAAAALTAARKA